MCLRDLAVCVTAARARVLFTAPANDTHLSKSSITLTREEAKNEIWSIEREVVAVSGSDRMHRAHRGFGIRSKCSGPGCGRRHRSDERISQVVYGQERPAARAVSRHERRGSVRGPR